MISTTTFLAWELIDPPAGVIDRIEAPDWTEAYRQLVAKHGPMVAGALELGAAWEYDAAVDATLEKRMGRRAFYA